MAIPLRPTYDQRVLKAAWEHLEQCAMDGAKETPEKLEAVQEALGMFQGILWPEAEHVETLPQ